MRRTLVMALAVGAVIAALAGPASGTTPKGELYLDGEVVGTVVPPAAIPHGGTDPLYMVTNGAEGQLGIAGEGPGDPGFNGGAWAVYEVTFVEGVTPYLLTSDEAVMQAEAAGDVTVVRNSSADNRCPVTRS